MRHRNKGFKLGRTAAHRKATLAELGNALIAHKRITTTLTKAKALRMFVEPILNRAKSDTTHNRRQVFRRLRSKEAVNTLYDDVATKIGEREGGYTRVVRLGQRQGDGAEMAVIELVDYNDVKPDGARKQKKTRRTRRGARKGTDKAASAEATAIAAAEVVTEAVEETADDAVEEIEAVAEEAPVAEVAEEAVEEAVEVVEDVAETAEEVVADPITDDAPVEEPKEKADEEKEEK